MRFGIRARIWVTARSKRAALLHVESLLEDMREADQDVTEVEMDDTDVIKVGGRK